MRAFLFSLQTVLYCRHRYFDYFQCKIAVRDFWDTREYEMEFYDLCILLDIVWYISVAYLLTDRQLNKHVDHLLIDLQIECRDWRQIAGVNDVASRPSTVS